MPRYNDIKVEWICDRPAEEKFRGRADACEHVCKEAAVLNGWTVIGIRHIDHNTTRVFTTVPGKHGLVTVTTDPHITVYVGYQSPSRRFHVGHGHLYVVYSGDNPNPHGVAHVRELRHVETGVNPEIWNRPTPRRSARLLRTYGV